MKKAFWHICENAGKCGQDCPHSKRHIKGKYCAKGGCDFTDKTVKCVPVEEIKTIKKLKKD
ncbi:MAG: hypothetical protein PHX21_12600 [bacterium]|nr:hypothetical protein [bacterium]